MRRLSDRLFLSLVLLVLIAGCSDPNDQFIQGAWYYKDPHLASVDGESQLEINWRFDRGTFEYYACCFSGELHQKGRYRILESEDEVISLELFNIQGGLTRGPVEVRITVDKEADTVSIQGAGPFSRTNFFQR